MFFVSTAAHNRPGALPHPLGAPCSAQISSGQRVSSSVWRHAMFIAHIRRLAMKIVLASASQFRKRALDMLGVPYEICPSRIDEKAIRDNDPASLTRKLARKGAKGRERTPGCRGRFR